MIAHIQDQVAGEGWLPAFLEDGALNPLHRAVGLRPAGVDGSVPDLELAQGVLEALGTELGRVVRHHPFELDTADQEIFGDSAGQS